MSKVSIGLKFNPVRFLATALKERAIDRDLVISPHPGNLINSPMPKGFKTRQMLNKRAVTSVEISMIHES